MQPGKGSCSQVTLGYYETAVRRALSSITSSPPTAIGLFPHPHDRSSPCDFAEIVLVQPPAFLGLAALAGHNDQAELELVTTLPFFTRRSSANCTNCFENVTCLIGSSLSLWEPDQVTFNIKPIGSILKGPAGSFCFRFFCDAARFRNESPAAQQTAETSQWRRRSEYANLKQD